MKRKYQIIILSLILVFGTFQFTALEYTLQKGDTLYSLSRKYNVTVSQIMEANDIDDPTDLAIGQTITIPGTSDESTADLRAGTLSEYRVVKGDTYYGIARRFDISLDELFSLNQRDASTVLKIGEVLKIRMDRPLNPETPKTSGSSLTWPHDGERKELTGALKGIEIEGQFGDPFYSVSTGKVILVQPFRTYNQLVIVETPDNYLYVYGGGDEILVEKDQVVAPGTKLGVLGLGPGGDAKVFFMVQKDKRYIQPESAPRL
jgi:LysM repeat protein